MRKIVVSSLILLLCLTFSISHSYDLEKISKADLSGIWATKNSFLWFYKDRTMRLLNKNCFLKARGNWKFEFGGLHIYVNGEEVFWRQVLEVPDKWIPGRNIRFADNSTWMFHGRDTGMKC